jgi:hypothetical protein
MNNIISRSDDLAPIISDIINQVDRVISDIINQVDRAIDSLLESGVYARAEAIIAHNRADQILGLVEDYLEACQIAPDARDRVNGRISADLHLDQLVKILDLTDEDWCDHITN